jgi:CubicO group peptidase (beta-lactamase class C family)
MTKDVLTFNFQPGTQSSYSGERYFYVARFAQNKVQKPFDQLAQQYVLGPVGMKDTSFTTQDWFSGRLAKPYVNNQFVEPQLTSTWNAADLVHTTVTDYAPSALARFSSSTRITTSSNSWIGPAGFSTRFLVRCVKPLYPRYRRTKQL